MKEQNLWDSIEPLPLPLRELNKINELIKKKGKDSVVKNLMMTNKTRCNFCGKDLSKRYGKGIIISLPFRVKTYCNTCYNEYIKKYLGE